MKRKTIPDTVILTLEKDMPEAIKQLNDLAEKYNCNITPEVRDCVLYKKITQEVTELYAFNSSLSKEAIILLSKIAAIADKLLVYDISNNMVGGECLVKVAHSIAESYSITTVSMEHNIVSTHEDKGDDNLVNADQCYKQNPYFKEISAIFIAHNDIVANLPGVVNDALSLVIFPELISLIGEYAFYHNIIDYDL